MKLRYSTASPFVRKVTVLAAETGLEDRIERVGTDAWAPDTDLPDDNPLGKVPALVLDDGRTLVDSSFICEYLDGLHDGPKLFPEDGSARLAAMRQHALANGAMEAAVLFVIETLRRPEALRWDWWIERQTGKIARTFDLLEREAGALGGVAGRPADIGSLSVAIALDYAAFRLPDVDWLDGRPALAAWHAEISQRPSLGATLPR